MDNHQQAALARDGVYLVKPSAEHEAAYKTFYNEWIASGEHIVPWVVSMDPTDFPAHLRFLQEAETTAPEGGVTHSTYWLMDEAGTVVGATNIRHKLNRKLEEGGGHIGYGIIPSQRRKGYAKAILSQALALTDRLGIREVLVICDRDNIGSERTIRANGGQFHSEITEENGNVVRRFWIHREL
ncbi:GNAT family N-acetyltransferase [Paenibacillus rhizovicinus]|uniref:GNAT family N-acetyltransferase n=1 Tax=Paenibacillus rhizovicinus TaxID=2704463 RepID=A0A6C0P250_9BACL|nr:GNAT family N-acetyltransferase [Paenibacillus rhizovicinus]QHW32431.1 GNAT family N-acetyltransferase [Paenibacillus rhizovicinus]